MIAIYARQSVKKDNSISIETQIKECKGKMPKDVSDDSIEIYADKGLSGKNTNRPEYQRMMRDIYDGKITAVYAYRLDRISRSVADFANMVEDVKRFKVALYIGDLKNIELNTEMGIAMASMFSVFAQLERKAIIERVKDAFHDRIRKGIYMGGPVPYGYTKEPYKVNGIQTIRFIPEPEEAEIVKMIYREYCKEKTSIGDIVHYFNDNNILKRGKCWRRNAVSDILNSPVYAQCDIDVYTYFVQEGAILINDADEYDGQHSCYYFTGEDAKTKKRVSLRDNMIVLAPHKGLIESDLWLKCKKKVKENKQVFAKPKAKNTWLAGKVKCGNCGYALVDKRYKDRNVRYLLCSRNMNSHACPGTGMKLNTDKVEARVANEIKKQLDNVKSVKGELKLVQKEKLAELKSTLAEHEKELARIIKALDTIENPTLIKKYDNDYTAEEKRRNEVQRQIEALQGGSGNSIIEIDNLVQKWDDLDFESKRKVVDAMIERIEICDSKFEITWKYNFNLWNL